MDTLVVKPGLSLEERISLGHYDRIDNFINEERYLYDPTIVGEWEYKLIYPNKYIGSDDAKVLCETDGWQVAKLEHILTFGEKFPEEQKEYPICALGSICEFFGSSHVTELYDDVDRRGIRLSSWDGAWSHCYRFLSVRKIPKEENLFIFSDFFTRKEGLFVHEDDYGRMESVRQAYLNPIPYKSIETLQLEFDLEKSMNDTEIIKKLGGKNEAVKNAVCMDQIEQLIKNQWGGVTGVMLNNGYANIFYVIGKDNHLFVVLVRWQSADQWWGVRAYGLDEEGEWRQGIRVFSNKSMVS